MYSTAGKRRRVVGVQGKRGEAESRNALVHEDYYVGISSACLIASDLALGQQAPKKSSIEQSSVAKSRISKSRTRGFISYKYYG